MNNRGAIIQNAINPLWNILNKLYECSTGNIIEDRIVLEIGENTIIQLYLKIHLFFK